jgi:hypothetical protein
MVSFGQKNGLATNWATFSQAHLVTLHGACLCMRVIVCETFALYISGERKKLEMLTCLVVAYQIFLQHVFLLNICM